MIPECFHRILANILKFVYLILIPPFRVGWLPETFKFYINFKHFKILFYQVVWLIELIKRFLSMPSLSGLNPSIKTISK